MRKKISVLFLCIVLTFALIGCNKEKVVGPDAPKDVEITDTAETLTGVGEGFNGDVVVEVIRDGDTILDVKVIENEETPEIAGEALKDIPNRIVEANSTEVDAISGATITSKAIMYAVNNALDPEKYPAPSKVVEEPKEVETVSATGIYQGFGLNNTGRKGPGKDDTDTQVWSTNQIAVHGLFDEDGKILYLLVDQVEVATPNYDGDGMPQFIGWPGQVYNYDSDHDGKVDEQLTSTEELFIEDFAAWATKRERGDAYRMGSGTWANQMDAYQELFTGKTVEEVEEWFTKYTSELNGRPLKDGSDKPEDKAKYDALTDEEKAMLADVTTSATMSLNDSHGDIVSAIKNAYENRKPLQIESAAAQGLGIGSYPRVGPGKDDKETPVFSINQIFANTLFDKDGKIVALKVDQLEIATPNYDGDGMPHFSGWPGQGGYNYDENHDGTVDGLTEDTEENFFAEIAGWMTKRERGDAYRMGSGTWTQQMDKFEEVFIGMTVEEVEEWFDKYTSDLNGRPLKDGSDKEEDKAKYDALTDEEKAMLADVTTSATMSLNDSHGNIIEAIRKSYENRVVIDLQVQ